MSRAVLSRRAMLAATAGLVTASARGARSADAAQTFRGTRAGEARDVAGISFRWCPAGRFVMGSPLTEPDRRADEGPVEVTLSRGFWIGATEVTQGQWQRLIGAFPDRPPTDAFGVGPTVPMYWVNYTEALTLCDALTAAARAAAVLPPGWRAHLPTEAQWEYACRAGTTGPSAFGSRLTAADANIVDDARPAQNARRAVPVRSYRPNAWGIFDMHGNIFEWCRDWYHEQLPGGVDPDLSRVPGAQNRDGTYSRCRRGGAWNDPPAFCRSAFRLRYEPERRSDHIGFRVVFVED